MGKGVAFELNVKTDKDNVIVDMYEEKIIDSNGQEHSIRLVNKDEEYNMVKMSDLDNMILFLECKSVSGRKYCYKYRIVNVEKYLVEYLGEIKDF